MITITFCCGHTLQATGNEDGVRCGCGETRIERVDTRAPHFRGVVLGPLAQFENLPPQSVPLRHTS